MNYHTRDLERTSQRRGPRWTNGCLLCGAREQGLQPDYTYVSRIVHIRRCNETRWIAKWRWFRAQWRRWRWFRDFWRRGIATSKFWRLSLTSSKATLATAHDERKELYELQLESELPLAELLRQYGISDVPTATENETIQVEETSTTNKESDWALNEGTMLEAERVAYEENVSSCHERLEYNTGLTKPLPRFPEPVTNKCHWLHVLEEMSWLSGDFSRERKWR